MRDKKELIMQFIDCMTPSKGDVEEQWNEYINEEKEKELEEIIQEEKLKDDETRKFMNQAFDGYVTTTGSATSARCCPM